MIIEVPELEDGEISEGDRAGPLSVARLETLEPESGIGDRAMFAAGLTSEELRQRVAATTGQMIKEVPELEDGEIAEGDRAEPLLGARLVPLEPESSIEVSLFLIVTDFVSI